MSFAEALTLPAPTTTAQAAERKAIVGRIGSAFYGEQAAKAALRGDRARCQVYAAASLRHSIDAVVVRDELLAIAG